MVEREGVDAQPGRRPGAVAMAALALHAKEPGVQLGFFMALNAFFGRTGELFVAVAILTVNFSMAPSQDEETGMVKVFHTIHAIMAFQTILAVIFLMLSHEVGIAPVEGMAGDTALLVKILQTAPVAIRAHQRLAVKVVLVPPQAEAGAAHVFKGLAFQHGRRPGLGIVAGSAIGIEHTPVCLGFCMAADAGRRCTRKQTGRHLPTAAATRLDIQGVAVGAFGLVVPARQGKSRLLVIEPDHAVVAIVAGGAVFTIIPDMQRNVILIFGSMAPGAAGILDQKFAMICMTG